MDPIKPMLAVQGKVFSSNEWIFEPKIDGTRCIAHISNDTVELQNRRLRLITHRYPEITRALQTAAGGCVLDGELAVFSKGIPDFSSLAVREQQVKAVRIDYLSKALPASYIVFDILYRGSESLMNLPLIERKSILENELQDNDFITRIDYLPAEGEAYFKAALKKGLEGIMAKRLASTYQPGVRSRDWVKIKKHLTLDLVVGGYMLGQGQRGPFFGSLLVGAYDSGKLVYMGRVGSGFSQQELEEISLEFKMSEGTPFFNPPDRKDVQWLKPELVVEVEAMEVSKRGHLRAPVFLRRRIDKPPEECTVDQLLIGEA
ncbi:MAG: DNA ligase [Methanotrichaceae archaeon]|nr:DNA ligase [Methanotrichaceae archaeon]